MRHKRDFCNCKKEGFEEHRETPSRSNENNHCYKLYLLKTKDLEDKKKIMLRTIMDGTHFLSNVMVKYPSGRYKIAGGEDSFLRNLILLLQSW